MYMFDKRLNFFFNDIHIECYIDITADTGSITFFFNFDNDSHDFFMLCVRTLQTLKNKFVICIATSTCEKINFEI